MSFDQILFLPFAVVAFILFRLLPAQRGWVLLAASLGFYLFAGWKDLVVVAILVLVNYQLSAHVRKGRGWLLLAIAANLLPLVYFKYRGFLFGDAMTSDVFSSAIMIPLGLSFYVFQFLAYQVDVYRHRIEPTKSLSLLALFILFFPHQVAGPIMRGHELIPQLAPGFRGQLAHRPLYGLGLALCLLGLIKKVVFADSLAPFSDAAFALGPADPASAWIGAAVFTLQIYLDFSGYSDIAVGLGYLLGVHLPFNFRQPYLALTPQDFWRRWHVTLSTWIRDYLYIPMGGRHGGAAQQAAVLVITMGLAGLWHGASWTFVFWGIGWGLAIVLWRIGGGALARLGRLQWVFTFLIVLLLWVPFRSASLADMQNYFSMMAGLGGLSADGWRVDAADILLVLPGLALLLVSQFGERRLFTAAATRQLLRADGVLLRSTLFGLITWLMLLPRGDVNPFIYFRF
ncbi:MAG: MBOAT family O-acyltransferase [Ferrovibrio sp.]